MIGGSGGRGGGGLKREKEGGGLLLSSPEKVGLIKEGGLIENLWYYLSLNYMYSTSFAVNAINNMQSL